MNFTADLRYAFRMLRVNPGFAAVAIITLALGIGATTAMFTVVNGVVLKSLRYPDAARIVAVNTKFTDKGRRLTGGDLEDLRADKDSFEAFSFYNGGEMGVQLARSAEFVPAFLVDPEFFHVFTTPPEVVVRTPGNPAALIPMVQNTVRAMNPEVATKFTTMTELVDDSITAQRFSTALASSFAVLALLLALSGMYAVMSYVTTRRTSEFGLRSALGAQRGNIVALVLGGAVRLAAIGVVMGVLLSIAASRLLNSMLFGLTSTDASTYAAVTAIVLPVIVLAAALPAWRASSVDPMIALRNE